MAKKFFYILIFIIAAILQTSVVSPIVGVRSIADAVLMLILAWSIIDGFSNFLSWAVFFGVIFDLLAYSRIGIHIIIFVITVYFVSFFSRRMSVDLKGIGLLFFLFFIILISIFSYFMTIMSGWLDSHSINRIWDSLPPFKFMVLQLFLNGLFFSIWFSVIKKTKSFLALEI